MHKITGIWEIMRLSENVLFINIGKAYKDDKIKKNNNNKLPTH